MLLLAILGYYRLIHFKLLLSINKLLCPRLFLGIPNNFNIWLLVVILLVLLMVINGY